MIILHLKGFMWLLWPPLALVLGSSDKFEKKLTLANKHYWVFKKKRLGIGMIVPKLAGFTRAHSGLSWSWLGATTLRSSVACGKINPVVWEYFFMR